MKVNITGRSKFEVESMLRSLDSINVFQRDSSEVVFEMSPDYRPESQREIIKFKTPNGGDATYTPPLIKSNEAMTIKCVKANLQGYSLLDLGHAQ